MVPELAKYIMLVQNLVVRRQTLNEPHEVIDTIYKKGDHSFYKLGIQKTNILFDLCVEPYGFNRISEGDKESIRDYITRMLENNHLYTRTDYSLHEFLPRTMKQINDILETHSHTFYFSISSSIKGKRAIKRAKEIL